MNKSFNTSFASTERSYESFEDESEDYDYYISKIGDEEEKSDRKEYYSTNLIAQRNITLADIEI